MYKGTIWFALFDVWLSWAGKHHEYSFVRHSFVSTGVRLAAFLSTNYTLWLQKYLYRKSRVFLWFSKSVGFALQNSRFYLAKPTLLQCETIGFGTPKRSCWLSACYVRCAKVVICNDFLRCFQVRFLFDCRVGGIRWLSNKSMLSVEKSEVRG